jgi:hypothetical protein
LRKAQAASFFKPQIHADKTAPSHCERSKTIYLHQSAPHPPSLLPYNPHHPVLPSAANPIYPHNPPPHSVIASVAKQSALHQSAPVPTVNARSTPALCAGSARSNPQHCLRTTHIIPCIPSAANPIYPHNRLPPSVIASVAKQSALHQSAPHPASMPGARQRCARRHPTLCIPNVVRDP